MPELVDWKLAERIAVRAAGREPFAESYLSDSLTPDFAELTTLAEELVAEETGLRSLAGPARAEVTDRAGWVRANVASFRRLTAPVTERVAPRMVGPSAAVMRAAGALEVGVLLGWMSARVLGQYDMLVAGGDGSNDGSASSDDDVVYYVGPNVLAIEKRFGFPPREFRLWLALHEVTHRAQFTGVPWMKDHYLGLVDAMLRSAGADPAVLFEAARRAVSELRNGRSPLADGVAHLLASPEQRRLLDQIGGLMSLLEGHGDVTMNRAGIGHVPSADRFARVLRNRRNSASGFQRFVQQLLGFEAKIAQYQQGEDFIADIERLAGGKAAIEPVWRGPSWLPTLAEIRDPEEWVERVRLSEELVG